MEKYIVIFYNRFANQIQTWKVEAENQFRAGRKFYQKYNREAYHDCIQSIECISDSNKMNDLLHKLDELIEEADKWMDDADKRDDCNDVFYHEGKKHAFQMVKELITR